jgi:hypothetical protein
MNIQKAFRIVEIKGGQPHTLFHGLPDEDQHRTRAIPLNTWVKAEVKQVRDGTGPYYLSGFNVLLTREELEDYMTRFTAPRDLRIVEIQVRGELRKKEHSRANVWLADEMYLPSQNFGS